MFILRILGIVEMKPFKEREKKEKLEEKKKIHQILRFVFRCQTFFCRYYVYVLMSQFLPIETNHHEHLSHDLAPSTSGHILTFDRHSAKKNLLLMEL